MFSKAIHLAEKVYWLTQGICLGCSLNVLLGYNVQSTKDILSVLLYSETEMERPNKGRSSNG